MNENDEYPKWIAPHADRVLKRGDGTPWVQTHEFSIDRAGNLAILVSDEADELIMTSPKKGTSK